MSTASVIIVSLLSLSTGFSFAQKSQALEFDNTKEKFGRVNEGKEINVKYPFKNTGTAAVVIDEASVNCKCTSVRFPRKPVLPNAIDTIFVDFDTKGKIGFQQRSIILKTNEGNYELVFQGSVKASEETKSRFKERNR